MPRRPLRAGRHGSAVRAVRRRHLQRHGRRERVRGVPERPVDQRPAAERGLRYYHSGNNGDFRAYCHFYLASGDGIVLFGNSDNVFSSNLAQRIVEYLGDEWFYV